MVRRIGKNDGTPVSLAMDAGYLYWAEPATGTIASLPKVGGSKAILCTDEDWPNSLVVSGDHIYFATVTEIRRVLKAGGESELVLGGGDSRREPRPSDITLGSSEELYWINGDRDICHTPKGMETWAVLASEPGGASGLAVDGAYLCWVSRQDGAIGRIAEGGGVVERFPSGTQNPEYLRSSATALFFAAFPHGGIFALPRGTKNVQMICETRAAVHGLAVDGEHAYWCSRTTQSVSWVRRTGGPATKLAETSGDPLGIIVDDRSVYWIEDDGGGIFAESKPHERGGQE